MLWIRDSSIYQELFETVGKLKSVKMIEVGVAEAVFYKRTDALKAHKEYNQIKLDGRQMFIQVEEAVPLDIAPAGAKTGKSATSRLGVKQFKRSAKGRGDVSYA